MKLLFENWRKYLNEEGDFNVLCENQNQGLLTEEEFFNKWEQMIISEAKQIFNEGLLDVLKAGFEAGKELFIKAVDKIASFFGKFVDQILKVILGARFYLSKIAGMLKRVAGKIVKFCRANKTVCKVITFILVMIAMTAVMAWMANEAEAAISTAGYSGEDTTLSDTGVDAIKGYLMTMQESLELIDEPGAEGARDRALARAIAEAVQWMENAQGMESVVDLKETSEEGARLIQMAFEHINDESMPVRALARIGEDVRVAVGNSVETINNITTRHEGAIRLMVVGN
tara:strand:+ start:1203 stop:2060 length:858 start_codon:yes stop_codon:yes gene_type:complete